MHTSEAKRKCTLLWACQVSTMYAQVYELLSVCKIAWGRETYFTMWQVKITVTSTICLIDVQEEIVRSLICGE